MRGVIRRTAKPEQATFRELDLLETLRWARNSLVNLREWSRAQWGEDSAPFMTASRTIEDIDRHAPEVVPPKPWRDKP